MTTTQEISYWISVIALSAVLIWGLRMVSRELQRPDSQGRTLLARALMEKEPARSLAQPAAAQATTKQEEEPSFSRVAGALGAVGLAATFIGIGYWIIYQLFSGTDLKKMNDLSTYFLAGSALFLPYAFNKIATIFK